MAAIRESDLPGIGRKFQVDTRSGDKLVIVVHDDDGRRELYHFDQDDPEESISMVTLDDAEARQVAGIIGGLTYQPRMLENIEVSLEDLTIEWFKVDPTFQCTGRTVGEMQIRKTTGAMVIAIIEKDRTKTINPGPEAVIRGGATLVVVGERKQVKALRRLLAHGRE